MCLTPKVAKCRMALREHPKRTEAEAMPTKYVDYAEVLADAPRDCWLALNEDETKVVGRGETVQEAVEEAKRAGVEDPVILWSPKRRIASVLK